MEYRVKQIGPWYYPQYKGWLFWHTIQTINPNTNGLMCFLDVRKLTLEDALKSIKIHKKILHPLKITIHKVE